MVVLCVSHLVSCDSVARFEAQILRKTHLSAASLRKYANKELKRHGKRSQTMTAHRSSAAERLRGAAVPAARWNTPPPRLPKHSTFLLEEAEAPRVLLSIH